MGYRIERDEPIPQAVRRIAREEIDGALADLGGSDHDAAVHSLRKRFKRLRALLRLVRDDLGTAKAHDTVLRDAGRALAEARDRRVVSDTARKLSERTGSEAVGRVAAALAERAPAGDPDLAGVAEDLTALRGEIEAWTLAMGREGLAAGIRHAYAQGRLRLAKAHAAGTALALHEWRKRVKELWYQATLVGADPALITDLDVLGDSLGLDHDHAVLDALIDDLCPPDERAAAHESIALERARLQEIAWGVGDRVYAPDPDAFVATMMEAAWNRA